MPQLLHDLALIAIGVFATLLAQAAFIQWLARKAMSGR